MLLPVPTLPPSGTSRQRELFLSFQPNRRRVSIDDDEGYRFRWRTDSVRILQRRGGSVGFFSGSQDFFRPCVYAYGHGPIFLGWGSSFFAAPRTLPDFVEDSSALTLWPGGPLAGAPTTAGASARKKPTRRRRVAPRRVLRNPLARCCLQGLRTAHRGPVASGSDNGASRCCGYCSSRPRRGRRPCSSCPSSRHPPGAGGSW